ncbi:MAG: hypothetical protein PHE98_13350, partial [Thauera propionica]|nr:hypothetical protein [Thauera propionica]
MLQVDSRVLNLNSCNVLAQCRFDKRSSVRCALTKDRRSERERLLDVRRIPSQGEAGEVDLLRCVCMKGKNKKV